MARPLHNGDSSFDHGFYISTSDNLLEQNKVYNNTGYGITIFMATANNNIVRYNTAHNNGTLTERACGILLSSGTNNVSHNNIAYGNFAGFCLGWRGTDSRRYNNIAYYNTQYGVYAS